jgi:hypothetical protein
MPDAPDDDQKPDNETMRAVKRAKASEAAVQEKVQEKKSIGWKTAAGIGIGSAAIAAALIYANKARKKDED